MVNRVFYNYIFSSLHSDHLLGCGRSRHWTVKKDLKMAEARTNPEYVILSNEGGIVTPIRITYSHLFILNRRNNSDLREIPYLNTEAERVRPVKRIVTADAFCLRLLTTGWTLCSTGITSLDAATDFLWRSEAGISWHLIVWGTISSYRNILWKSFVCGLRNPADNRSGRTFCPAVS
jgi:hypothetical protein